MLSYKSRGQRYEKTLQHTYIYPESSPHYTVSPLGGLSAGALGVYTFVHFCIHTCTQEYTQ